MSVVAPHFAFRTATLLPTASIVAPPLPEMLIELGKSDRPLALFPVRLETRFFPQPNGGSELRVRVYPDRIHIDSHEEELTQAEKTWGQHYWTQIFLAGDDTQAQKNAWRQLADRYDPQRAAWIARLLRPTNVGSRTASTEPTFPRVDVVEEGKDAAWRSAPKARLLPVRWIAIVQGAGRVIAAGGGRDIRPELAVGPDPQVDGDNAPEIPGDQAAVDPGMRWMVDFDEAEAAGMGLRIALTAANLAGPIESLKRYGVTITEVIQCKVRFLTPTVVSIGAGFNHDLPTVDIITANGGIGTQYIQLTECGISSKVNITRIGCMHGL